MDVKTASLYALPKKEKIKFQMLDKTFHQPKQKLRKHSYFSIIMNKVTNTVYKNATQCKNFGV